VSLRITASGELHDLADYLAALEYGPLRVTIPFIELSRRGAMVRKGGVGRTVSATIQVSGVVQGTAKLQAVQPVAAKGGDAAPDGAAPAASLPAAGGDAPVAAPPAALGARPAKPSAPDQDHEPLPADPLGTGDPGAPQ
jgi:hypothetical protein